MRRLGIVGVVALSLAGCAQTTGSSGTREAASRTTSSTRVERQKVRTEKKDACAEAMQGQTNAAMLGGALGMVGGFGGFAGRGGAVAGHIASTAGGVIANQAANDMQDCY